MREARLRGSPVDLLVASDGWFISLGFNTDRGVVPSVGEVRAALTAAGMPWDPSVVNVLWCGLSTTGQSAAKVSARDQILTDLLSVDGQPAPQLFSSCNGFYAPVPSQLLSAPAPTPVPSSTPVSSR